MSVLPLVLLCAGLGFLVGSFDPQARLSGGRTDRTPKFSLLLWASVGVVSCVGAIVADGRPTEVRVMDVALRAGFALLAVWLAAKVRGVLLVGSTMVFAVGAAVGATRAQAEIPVLVVAFLAAGYGVATLARRPSPTSAKTGEVGVFDRAFLGLALSFTGLRLPTGLPSRVPSTVVAVVVVVLAAATVRRLEKRLRRRLVAVVSGLAIVGFGAAFAGAITLRGAKQAAERGVTLAKAGLTAARSGDQAGAELSFAQAEVALLDSRAGLRTPVGRVGRVVPVVAQHLATLDRLTLVATDVVRSARLTSGEAQTSSFKASSGQLNLDRITQLAGSLRSTTATLDMAQRELARPASDWLLPQVTQKLSGFRVDIDDANREAKRVEALAVHLPAMLGGSGERHYLLVVPTPAEARGSGGVIGNYGEIMALNGKISLTRFGRQAELGANGINPEQRVLRAPADYLRRYKRFEAAATWSNINMSPDFGASAMAMASLYPQSGGREVDGVISVDPFALQALLGVLGPLSVPGWSVPLDGTNAAKVLLHEAYLEKADALPERITLLADVTKGVWDKLRGDSLPNPRTLAEAMAGPVGGRHLQLWMRNVDEQTYLDTVGITGRVLEPKSDGFGVVVNNASANKIEYFLHRSIRYEATVSPDGATTALATVALRNDAPPSGLPDYVIGNSVVVNPPPKGTSLVYVSVYSPLSLRALRVDGQALPANEIERDTELGQNVYSAWLRLPSRSTRTVVLELAGKVAIPSNVYRLNLFTPPSVNPDETTVTLRPVGQDGGSTQPARPRTVTSTVAGRRATMQFDLLLGDS